MIIGLPVFTALHVAISLMALVSGILAILSLFRVRISAVWVGMFLITSIIVNVTGFLFPFQGATPAFVTGIVASLVLIAVLIARFIGRYSGPWRWIYAAGLVASLYFMVFVTIAQIFTKTLIVQEAGPLLSQGFFALTQLVTLGAFILLGIRAAKDFMPDRKTV